MSCSRICRELLWLARFGEFGPSSAPHLDHLAECGHCRDEVGFDRALVQQLRAALAERVANEEPSPRAWGVILERAQAPERGIGAFVRGHAAAVAARLRTATAVTAVALAGLVATSTHVAVTHPEARSAETEVIASAAGEHFERQPMVPRPRGSHKARVMYVRASAPRDPEAAFMVGAMPASNPPPPVAEVATGETTIESRVFVGPGVSRLTPADHLGSVGPAPATRQRAPAADVLAGEPF